jgi:hypothetical protein
MKIKNQFIKTDIVVFISLIIFVKILGSYKFGLGDQTAQLPSIFRMLDDKFILNDFFVNIRENFGPRYYYNHFISFLGKFLSLELVYLFLTIIINFTIAILTYLVSMKLFNQSKLIAFISTALVLTVNPFVLGGGGWVVNNYLKPALLARPFAYFAIWFAINQKPYLLLIMACISSLFHPTLGLETGAFSLGVLFLGNIYKIKNHNKFDLFTIFNRMLPLLMVSLIFGLFALICWVLPYDRSLSSEKFIEIMTFRAWSSLLPSYFDLKGYLGSTIFLITLFISWITWKRKDYTDSILPNLLMSLFITVILFCSMGFIFVEIFPTRAFMTAWTFRTLYIVKWLGMIIISGSLISYLQKENNKLVKFINSLIPFKNYSRYYTQLVYLIIAILFYLVFKESGQINPLYYFGSISLVFWFFNVNKAVIKIGFPIFCSFLVLLNVVNPLIFKDLMIKNRPVIKLVSNIVDDGALGIAEYSKEFTEPDAIFLTPPGFGGFRLSAERAIVIDYKSIPFQDLGLLGWWERMNDCYGELSKGNPKTRVKEIFEDYKNITSKRIDSIEKKYNISYVVLYTQTKTNLPIVYSDNNFKLVKASLN